MAANNMTDGRGLPRFGPRNNGKDPWKKWLCDLIFTGIIKELNRNDVEYGMATQTLAIRNFTFMDGEVMKCITVSIKVEHK